MDTAKFNKAILLFDEYNNADPKKEFIDGQEISASLLYAYRMSEKLKDFEPNASESLQLAASCQHIGRWEIPRSKYPIDRSGYLLWRSKLKKLHADIASKLMKEVGYADDMISKVTDLLLKKHLKQNQETQTLEDVVCLVFLQFYFDDFSSDHEEEKLVNILKKTIPKMSKRGTEAAMQLPLSQKTIDFVKKALAGLSD